jgi:hypothetical protein
VCVGSPFSPLRRSSRPIRSPHSSSSTTTFVRSPNCISTPINLSLISVTHLTYRVLKTAHLRRFQHYRYSTLQALPVPSTSPLSSHVFECVFAYKTLLYGFSGTQSSTYSLAPLQYRGTQFFRSIDDNGESPPTPKKTTPCRRILFVFHSSSTPCMELVEQLESHS